MIFPFYYIKLINLPDKFMTGQHAPKNVYVLILRSFDWVEFLFLYGNRRIDRRDDDHNYYALLH